MAAAGGGPGGTGGPRRREETAAPAFLVLAPGLLALLFPLFQSLLVVSWWNGPGFVPMPWFLLFRLALGASAALLCLCAGRLRGSRPARITIRVWALLMGALTAAYLLLSWWGGYSFFLSYWSMENVMVVLGVYLALALWMGNGGEPS